MIGLREIGISDDEDGVWLVGYLVGWGMRRGGSVYGSGMELWIDG